MIQFDEHIFQVGWNHQLEIHCFPTKITHFWGSQLDVKTPFALRWLHSTFLRWASHRTCLTELDPAVKGSCKTDHFQTWKSKNHQEKDSLIWDEFGFTIATPLKVVSVGSSHQMPDFSAWPPELGAVLPANGGIWPYLYSPVRLRSGLCGRHGPKSRGFWMKNEFGWEVSWTQFAPSKGLVRNGSNMCIYIYDMI